MKNLAELKCRECGSLYDTPHHQDCSYRRTGSKPQVLVKYNHVDLEPEGEENVANRGNTEEPA